MPLPATESRRNPPADALRLQGWLAVLAIWIGFGIMESGKAYLVTTALGLERSAAQLFENNLPWWLFWAALTPLVFALSRRWPLGPDGRLPRAILIHTSAAFVFSLVHLTATMLVLRYTMGSQQALGIMWTQWISLFLFLEIFTYASIVAAHHAIVHYRLFRERQDAAVRLELAQERLKTEVATAKLQSLQMELQPHFLFNTFNAITVLVRRNRNRAAVEMLIRLGELLRRTLERGRELRIPLDEEVELARCYLEIQEVRFPDLRLTSEIEPEAERALVPTLILQPLFENAIRYGLSRSGPTCIHLRARVENGRLRIEIEDPGSGGNGGGRSEGHGIGLANTRARLEQLWGGDVRLGLDHLATGGTLVFLDVPFVTADAVSAEDHLALRSGAASSRLGAHVAETGERGSTPWD